MCAILCGLCVCAVCMLCICVCLYADYILRVFCWCVCVCVVCICVLCVCVCMFCVCVCFMCVPCVVCIKIDDICTQASKPHVSCSIVAHRPDESLCVLRLTCFDEHQQVVGTSGDD